MKQGQLALEYRFYAGGRQDHAKVQPGEEVLVLGAAGGVGALTVQLATPRGERHRHSPHRHQRVRDLGAKRVIDVRSEAFDDPGPAYDVVIDTVGGRDTGPRLFGATTRRPADHPVCTTARGQSRHSVRARTSRTRSRLVSGCRNANRPTVSPSHLVGGMNAT